MGDLSRVVDIGYVNSECQNFINSRVNRSFGFFL